MDYKIEKLDVNNGDVLVFYYKAITGKECGRRQAEAIQQLISKLVKHYKSHGKDVLVLAFSARD